MDLAQNAVQWQRLVKKVKNLCYTLSRFSTTDCMVFPSCGQTVRVYKHVTLTTNWDRSTGQKKCIENRRFESAVTLRL
jgi:hypothetical protein